MRKLYVVLAAVAALGLSCRAEARDAVLMWTATGDDGTVGRATSYQIRYKSTPPASDTLSWWNAAGTVPAPVPSVSGAVDSVRVTNFDAATSWYFMMVAIDEAGNMSGWSNVAVLSALDVVRPARITGLIVVPR